MIELFELHPTAIKRFEFEWLVDDPGDLQLLERREPDAAFEPLAVTLGEAGASLLVPLHLRAHASYMLRACNAFGCTESEAIEVDEVEPAIGFIKSPEPSEDGLFGKQLALSGDGHTLAVIECPGDGWVDVINVYGFDSAGGTWQFEASFSSKPGDGVGHALALSGDGRTLVFGAPGDDGYDAVDSGAVYVYERGLDGTWTQTAYIKSSNFGYKDNFGLSVAIDRAGDTLVVGAAREWSFPAGDDSDPSDDSAPQAGAVYVFERGMDGAWTEQQYIKEPSYTGSSAQFGYQVQLDAEGQTLLVATTSRVYTHTREAGVWQVVDVLESHHVGYDNPTLSPNGEWMVIKVRNQDVDGVYNAGSALLYERIAGGGWAMVREFVAPIPGEQDYFGASVAFDHDGRLLLIGARGEDSSATGIDGIQDDDSSHRAGAAYLFERDPATNAWSLRSYLKAPNTGSPQDLAAVGTDVAISDDGQTLALSAPFESSAAAGVQGEPEPDSSIYLAGAVYLY